MFFPQRGVVFSITFWYESCLCDLQNICENISWFQGDWFQTKSEVMEYLVHKRGGNCFDMQYLFRTFLNYAIYRTTHCLVRNWKYLFREQINHELISKAFFKKVSIVVVSLWFIIEVRSLNDPVGRQSHSGFLILLHLFLMRYFFGNWIFV